MNKRVLNSVIAALAGCCSLATAEPVKPNILILMAEDMSSRVAAFGDSVAVTPNLDALASESIRYPNTFTAAGVCAPSRAAHITGMHQISFGAQHMRSSNGPTGGYKAVPPASVKAYPELLRAHGYYTWTGFKLDYQFSGSTYGSGPFTIWDDEGEGNDVAAWRQRQPGQPFFGLINYNITHESGVLTPLWSWPNSGMHLVMQLMRAYQMPSVPEQSPVASGDIEVPPYYPDTDIVRADMARHYNNITVMDAQIGDILDQLDADGLTDSTIIVWTTDHGDGLPRAKRDLFDSGIKVPMIIRWPEAFRPEGVDAGSVETRLISFVDLAPTLLRLAGAEVPEYIQGQDFIVDAPREYIFASRDRIDSVVDRQRSVRDQRYKYIRSWYPDQPGGHPLAYRDNMAMIQQMHTMYQSGELNAIQRQWFEAPGEERLFDTEVDPFEINNLAADPVYQETLKRMRAALADWQGRVEDWSEQPEQQMADAFNPGGEVPVTSPPQVSRQGHQVQLSSQTEGASIGYRIDGGRWQLYHGAIELGAQVVITAKAIRYGWQESEEISFELAP